MALDSHGRAAKTLRLGIAGAMGFAAWLGIPLLMATAAGHVGDDATSRIEMMISGLLIGFALLTAWRFRKQKGWIAGPILLVALIVEVAKRIILGLVDIGPSGVVDLIIVALIFIGLLSGVRAARAMRPGSVL